MNKLTAEKCREQFEEWAKKNKVDTSIVLMGLSFPPVFIGYENKDTQGKWLIWLESRESMEFEFPILEQQERVEWIEWGGGDQPVGGDVMVETKWSDGAVTRGEASEWRWKCTLLSDINIIAYRIIPERATNQNGDDA